MFYSHVIFFESFCIDICQLPSSQHFNDTSTARLDLQQTHKKNNSRKPARATTIPIPPLERSWREESKSASTIFVTFVFDLLFQNNFSNISQRKNSQTRIGFALSNTCLSRSQILQRCLGLYRNYFLVSQGSQADFRALDNIELAFTSNGLVRIHQFIV